jgi:hypothetical protein
MNRQVLAVAVVLAMLAAFWGCRSTRTTSGASTGPAGYITGAYTKTYSATVDKVYEAALRMLQDDKIAPYNKEIGATTGLIEATLADGKTVTIDLKASGTNTTDTTIKIGALGDTGRSNYFFEKLDKILVK